MAPGQMVRLALMPPYFNHLPVPTPLESMGYGWQCDDTATKLTYFPWHSQTVVSLNVKSYHIQTTGYFFLPSLNFVLHSDAGPSSKDKAHCSEGFLSLKANLKLEIWRSVISSNVILCAAPCMVWGKQCTTNKTLVSTFFTGIEKHSP